MSEGEDDCDTPWVAFDEYDESLTPGDEYMTSMSAAVAEAAVAAPGQENNEDDFVPAMPTVPNNQYHRDVNHGGRRLLFNAVVARPVGRKEIDIRRH